MRADSPAVLHQLFERAFNAGDVDLLVALYEPGATLVVGGRENVGREAIRTAFRDLLPGRGRLSLETCAVVTSQLGLAVLHGAWVVEPSDGTRSRSRTQGRSTEVVRQQPDGTWLFVIDTPYTPGSPGPR